MKIIFFNPITPIVSEERAIKDINKYYIIKEDNP
jgi:hypothetical protein